MKLSISREALLKPLQLVSGVVERKQTLAVLGNVLLVVEDKQLMLYGTDTEVELIGYATLEKSATAGRVTVPARKLMDICKSLPEHAQLTLTLDASKMLVSSGRSRFTLTTLPANEFPRVEQAINTAEFTLPQTTLRFLLDRTYFSMAQQDVRYYLNGTLIDIKEGVLRAIATNGHRLALSVTAENLDPTLQLHIIIPRKGVMELLRLLENTDDDISVCVSANHLRIDTPDFTLTSKLIDGRFPDYERVLPKNGDKIVSIDRLLLKQVLSRVAILSNDKYRGIRCQLRDNLLTLSANNPDQEEAQEEIAIDYGYEPLDIGFNVNYFLDVLASIPTEQVKLTFTDSNTSVLIEGDTETTDCLYVIMPMRL